MATIKYVFIFLTLSTLHGSYHARPLHDISIHEIFNRLSTFQAANVIQMVTGLGKPPRPPGAPPQGQTTLNQNSVVTSIDELTESLSLEAKPKPAPPQGQTTYGVDNTKSNRDTEEEQDLLVTKLTTSMDKMTNNYDDKIVYQVKITGTTTISSY
ncbi:uncharacterized protein [Rutidosis leptorrhynchoides]|uniref:uncharacterized protein n=1 Tax=Rutidosis leptorrhynchoides TaxID=125765 RepID=UPI003A98EEAA